MKGLLIKDYRILTKQKIILILIVIMGVLLPFGSDDGSFLTNYAILVLSLFSLSTISYDEMNGGLLFLLSLPADRKTYVKEKYVFTGLNMVISSLFSLGTGDAAALTKQTGEGIDSLALGVAGTVLVIGIMISVAIPLTLKFGAEKGRMLIAMATMGVGAVIIIAYKTLTDVFQIDLIGGLGKLLGGIESEEAVNGILIGGLLIVLLLVMYCSYLISNRVMKRKEF